MLYATFASTGPLRGCYATIQTDSEVTARKYLRFHFPYDFTSLYREAEFAGLVEKHSLKKIFEKDLSSLNEP